MYFVLSPAKKLRERAVPGITLTAPEFAGEAAAIVRLLREATPRDLAHMMGISDRLAVLNLQRFVEFERAPRFPAAFLFDGDAYRGLDIGSLKNDARDYLFCRLGILSGLYGLLRPSDGIAPHRLDMGTPLSGRHGRNLYDFWGDRITRAVEKRMREQNTRTLINLASAEYARALCRISPDIRLITPVFKEYKEGRYLTVSFYAKRARGMMVRYAAERQSTKAEDLRDFAREGYVFRPELSDEKQWLFVRG